MNDAAKIPILEAEIQHWKDELEACRKRFDDLERRHNRLLKYYFDSEIERRDLIRLCHPDRHPEGSLRALATKVTTQLLLR